MNHLKGDVMAKPKKERKTNPLPTEPRARFEALVSRRVTTALAAIENVGKIARSKPIEYGESDVTYIYNALLDATGDVQKALNAGLQSASGKPVKQVFTLPTGDAE